jgi:hypothetical protein
MTDSVLDTLRRLLVDDYRGLKERLARRFGSADFAGEVLHEGRLRPSHERRYARSHRGGTAETLRAATMKLHSKRLSERPTPPQIATISEMSVSVVACPGFEPTIYSFARTRAPPSAIFYTT